MNYTILLKFYSNNARPALEVFESGVKFGMLSTNIPVADVADNEFLAKLYSENKGWAGLLLEQHPEWFTYTKRFVRSGHVEFPIYRLTPTFISDQFDSTYNSRIDIYEADCQLFDLHKRYCES